MADDLAFYQRLGAVLGQETAVVATVIHTSGSVPREVGAQLGLTAGGQTWGTIGGGAGEAKVLQQAKTVLAQGQPQRVTIDLSGRTAEGDGICGGQMRVWLACWQGPQALALAQTLVRQLAQGQGVELTIPLRPSAMAYIADSQAQPGASAGGDRFCQRLQPPPLLLIVGAGHCGIELAQTAALSGFRVAVQDERPAWANASRFPQAEHLYTQPVAAVLPQLPPTPALYVALVTRGFTYDVAALVPLLQRQPPCHYIGLMGSHRRVGQVLQALGAQGYGQAQLQVLHAPIGLDIGALTPAEIAVSIVAELIAVRRGGTGQPLSASRAGG